MNYAYDIPVKTIRCYYWKYKNNEDSTFTSIDYGINKVDDSKNNSKIEVYGSGIVILYHDCDEIVDIVNNRFYIRHFKDLDINKT